MDVSLADISVMAQADGESSSGPTCAAGSCNAICCNFSGTIMVLGTGVTVSNGVTCTNGQFACCHLTAYCFDPSLC